MFESRARHNWDIGSSVMAMVRNASGNFKSPAQAFDFNPFRKEKKEGKLSDLKAIVEAMKR